jgi:hypothetical protein
MADISIAGDIVELLSFTHLLTAEPTGNPRLRF